MVKEAEAPKVAIIYDFDRTLSCSEMQDGFIRYLELEPASFWKEVEDYAKTNCMDHILAYLHLLVIKSKEKGKPINREVLNGFGKDIKFYDGVEDWFDLIDGVGEQYGVSVEHYIVSAGQKEIMEGTPIYGKFKGVYACEYYYDCDEPVWLKNVINSTTKTQYIFRINKGALDIWSDRELNEFRDHRERKIQVENIIYIGDGESDIPCMKIVKEYGGHSIAVYDGEVKGEKTHKLVYDERVNYACKADYREGSELFDTVSKIIGQISFSDPLLKQEYNDYTESELHFKRKEQDSS